MTTDLTTQSPAEIDALWAPLASEYGELQVRSIALRTELHNAEALLSDVESGKQKASFWVLSDARHAVENTPARIERLAVRKAELADQMVPFADEWARRNGWTRAYLVVTNGQGHVHRSMDCSTCYPTTQFTWMTEYSGASEQEIVDAAGERACTVCYKSAPVQLRLDRPTSMFSAEEKAKQAARDERAAKKAEKDAKRLLHPVSGAVLRAMENDFRTGELRESHEIGKTERGAMTAAIQGLNSYLHYGPSHPSAEGWIATADLVSYALAQKNGGEYAVVRADLNERAQKSYKREFGQAASRSFPEVTA